MKKQGLYNPENEHDSCGVGFVANINGKNEHQIITDGLTILKNLVHRGAVGGDKKTGDGCGLLSQIPYEFFNKIAKDLKIKLPLLGEFGVGFFFLPENIEKRKKAINFIEKIINEENGEVLGWRDVPVKKNGLGQMALENMPSFHQIFVTFNGLKNELLERKLYIVRKVIENTANNNSFCPEEFYIPSFSSKTINYKGMLVAEQLENFYPDLSDVLFKSTLALVHQRYSTNTFPSWNLAQPFRFIAHNGEINTLRGNVNKLKAMQSSMQSELFGEDLKKLFPIVMPNGSDSAVFDNCFELLTLGGRSLEHSMMMMVPEPFGKKYHISEDKRAFYEFHSAIMEPWDGPAAIAFTDGSKIGAVLDRNGLRPARYILSKKGKIVLASEAGVLDIKPEDVLEKGRLAPGKMILVDTVNKRFLRDHEIKSKISRQKPYRRWLEENRIELKGLFQTPETVEVDKNQLLLHQNIFGYTLEDLNTVITPMVMSAQEPVGSMGNDAALAILSDKPQLLYNYFKQLFAQVTNPPIDPYRENLVMSLMSFIGREQNILEETHSHCHQLKLLHPILSNDDINVLKKIKRKDFKVFCHSILFNIHDKNGISNSLKKIAADIEHSIDNGASIIILSDKDTTELFAPIPALIAVSFLHNHLIKVGKRQLIGLIVETGETRDVMHYATLIGYGASAINPYLALQTISNLHQSGNFGNDFTIEQAIDNYITAVKKGLLKIISKMGISTLRSYKGAQIFEAVGLNSQVIDEYFPGTPSRIGGIGISEIQEETLKRFKKAYEQDYSFSTALTSGGNYHFRQNTENRIITGDIIKLAQRAVMNKDYNTFKIYSSAVNDQSKRLCTLRGLFKLKKCKSISINEVEPITEIVKRFVTSAMSFGSISKEAHEAMAIAMNRIGGMSNSGEGGEEEERYKPYPNGDSAKSAVKQIASGRFGVTINYITNSNELQIKMAQGAKPGEGGQLPGHKVNKVIAKVRHSTPGVMLISPPPHHDIYSIEDLAQLIFDLKNGNPKARVSVKLVSEVGVGTIAAGVAKGKADMVLIASHDGGTGASPISSVKYAGIPWEIGLAETQQTLVLNKLRDKIRVQVDGKLLTGRDVIIGALLGAEEFGFGTISLITLGCVMMRKCHLNTCPVGVATQDPELRKKFHGKPEYIVNFMNFIAEEVREIMAELGIKKFDDLVGRVDLIEADKAISHWKTKGLDFSLLLHKPKVAEGTSLRCIETTKPDFSLSLDPLLIEKCKDSITNGKKINLEMPIKNCNRTVGAMLSHEIAKVHGLKGLANDTINVNFSGSAGQSFGAFLSHGVTLKIEGDCNDYLGKGLSGGRIILVPPKNATFRPQNNIITGNVNLFGATSGEVFIHGMAGERFAVRNSGAIAVVEGVGDHGCEYMTGGIVVVLGQTGINFAAGMSGGIAYVLDENQLFDTRCNLEMVNIEQLNDFDIKQLHTLIEKHVHYTNSAYAKSILDDMTEMLSFFVKVMPIEYKKALEKINEEQIKQSENVTMTEEVILNG